MVPFLLHAAQTISTFQEQTFPQGALMYPPDRPTLNGRHLDVSEVWSEIEKDADIEGKCHHVCVWR